MVVLAAGAGCFAHRSTTGPVRDPAFECADRRMEYTATGTIMYAKQGVRLYCDGNVPTAEKWFLDKDGNEQKRSAEISAGTFDDAWKEFQAAGWRMLEEKCDNPTAAKKDPDQTFEVTDGDLKRHFQCKGTELPFPYDRLRNALDLSAGEIPGE
jgi:hypothetical protein